MCPSRSTYHIKSRQPFHTTTHSPGCEDLAHEDSVFEGIAYNPGMSKRNVADAERRRSAALTTGGADDGATRALLEEVDLTTPSSDGINAAKRAPMQRNRRLAVDLAYDDDVPTMWTTVRRVMHNLWLSVKMMRLFLSLAWTDIKARTCSYCLGFFSVFVVVLLCVIMISLLTNMPIVFLRLSEATRGEFDLSIGPGSLMSQATGLNYTMIKEYFPYSDRDYGLHAPRILDMYSIRPLVSCPGKTASGLWYYPTGGRCGSIGNCLATCNETGSTVVTVLAIDAAAETRMGFGTDYSQPTPGHNELILSRHASLLMGNVAVGDTVFLYGNARVNLQEAFRSMSSGDGAYVMIPYTVISIMGKDERKFPNLDAFVVVSYGLFIEDVAAALSPSTSSSIVDSVAATSPDVTASAVYFIMNPAARLQAYGQSSYNTIRSKVVSWASGVLAPLGFMQVGRATPQLRGLYATRMLTIFLNLIMSMILLALAFLSVVLIYTLLTVGVETKTYELGIQRMVGLTKENLVVLVLANAYAFTIPAWILGLAGGQGAYVGIRAFFVKMLDVELPLAITGASAGWATLAGLGIPIVASYFPILSLVTQQLPDAINTSRSRNNAVVYKIQRSDPTRWNGTMFGLGLLAFVFGFLIYFLFPTALITMNLSLVFYIFFGVLTGLLAGFVLLTMNFERVAQTSVSYLLLFWESKPVFSFMQKTLSAHRQRNRKTSMMYALSLAFVIFITVAVEIELNSFTYTAKQSLGCEVVVTTGGLPMNQFWDIERQLVSYQEEGYISGYTYEFQLPAEADIGSSTLYSLGRFQSSTAAIVSAPPNYFDVLDKRYLLINEVDSLVGRYGMAQSLYSRDGMYKSIMSSGAAIAIGIGKLVGAVLLEMSTVLNATAVTTQTIDTTARPVATLDTAPVLSVSKYTTDSGSLVLGIPGSFRQMNFTRTSVLNGTVTMLRLRVPKPSVYNVIGDVLVSSIADYGFSASVTTVTDETSDMATAGNLLNMFFILAEIMILVICFFSLMSSMTTNVLDSSKEIGVLLCMGMSHFQVYRVFVLEAFVLVVAAGLMGLVVGLVVAYTMMLQNQLFVQISIPFPFPYVQLCIVVIMGFLSALASSISPVAYLLGLPSITHILRRTIN